MLSFLQSVPSATRESATQTVKQLYGRGNEHMEPKNKIYQLLEYIIENDDCGRLRAYLYARFGY